MILSLLIFMPLIFAIAVGLATPRKWVRPVAVGLSLIEFILSLVLVWRFEPGLASLQFVERVAWIPSFGISYLVGVDGLSLWLVVLTCFLTPIIILASPVAITEKIKGFHASLLLLESAMVGSFLALDTILFYVFWEFSLIPMYFIVGIWGGPRRIYAAIKLFIFTMTGSVLMLVAIIYMMHLNEAHLGYMSASLLDFYNLRIPFIANEFFCPQTLIFFAFALAFAIKVPMFPFHTWLPDAHVEAPTAGSVILAAVMLKMGTYGFLRFAIPLFPEAVVNWGWIFLMLGAFGLVYGALVAMAQQDIKKLVAYSSVSHMGYVVLGLFSLNSAGLSGALYQMLNHGISTGALFLLVGMIYERTHSRDIDRYGGLASVMPKYALLFFIITLSSIAVPLTNGFVGEFLILIGIFRAYPLFAYIGVLGVVLGAAYMLWLFKRVFWGPAGELIKKDELTDLHWREWVVLSPLVVLVFWMGIFPQHFLKYSEASIEHLVKNRTHYNLSIAGRVGTAGREKEIGFRQPEVKDAVVSNWAQ